MPALVREALEFAIPVMPIILGAILGMIGSVHSFRKIRRKGHRLPIAILVMIAGFLFGAVIAGLAVYSLLGPSVFNCENPSELSVAASICLFFFAAAVFSVVLIAGIATLLPQRRSRIAGQRREWKRDQKLAYRLATFFLALFAVLLLWRSRWEYWSPNLDTGWVDAMLLWSAAGGGLALWGARALAKRAAAAGQYLKPSETSERFVLYLREFERERRPFVVRSEQPRQPCLDAALKLLGPYSFTPYENSTPLTLEQYLSPALESGLAPLVALGRPDDYLPPSGAAREYVADQVWQERFEDLAIRSIAVLLLPGSSNSLNWELGFLLSEGLAPKLFLVFGSLAFSRGALQPKWVQKLMSTFDIARTMDYQPLDWSRFVAATRAAGYNLAPRAPTRSAVIAFDREGNSFELPGAFVTPQEYVQAIKAWLNQSPSPGPQPDTKRGLTS
jgi:hypothetical protein